MKPKAAFRYSFLLGSLIAVLLGVSVSVYESYFLGDLSYTHSPETPSSEPSPEPSPLEPLSNNRAIPEPIPQAKILRQLQVQEALLPKPDPVNPREVEAAAVEEYFDSLTEGQFFHTVPTEMQVNVETTIEAGLAKEDAAQVARRLGIEGKITIRSKPVRYDPFGTEVDLIAEDFHITPVSIGRQPVFPGDEPLWIWRVKPLSAGTKLIILNAMVEYKSPNTGQTYKRTFVTFQEKRQVKVNVGYTVQQFVATNWQEVLARLIGPGCVAGLVGWWIGRRRENAEKKTHHPAGFISAINSDSPQKSLPHK